MAPRPDPCATREPRPSAPRSRAWAAGFVAILAIAGALAIFPGMAHGAGLAPPHPASGAQAAPNLTLNGSNGPETYVVSLYYTQGAHWFSANASLQVAGGVGPYQVSTDFGFGAQRATIGSANQSGANGSAGATYTSSGNYWFSSSVNDSTGRSIYLATNIFVSLGPSPATLNISIQDTTNGFNGTPTTQFNWYVSNVVGAYNLTLSFGDGNFWTTHTWYRGNVSHTYTAPFSSSPYPINATAVDSSGQTSFWSGTWTPSYAHPCNGGGGGGGVSFSLSNGSLWVHSTITWTTGCGQANLTAVGNASGGQSPYWLRISYGDGGGVLAQFGPNWTTGNMTSMFSYAHTYTQAGNYTLTLSVTDINRTSVSAHALVLVPGNSSTGPPPPPPPPPQFYVNGSNGSSALTFSVASWLNGSVGAATYEGSGVVTGGVAPYRLSVSWGDGGLFNLSTHNQTTQFHLSHDYAAGNFTLQIDAFDSNGSSAFGFASILVPAGNHTPFPQPVTVVVDASPVSGTAPLFVTLSALISGGSAPFSVVWSLPNGTATSNVSGLEVDELYSIAGWFPATAFVYNTTSGIGSNVLVGYGSVWIYVASAGSGGGNGSGNGSDHPHGHPPLSGGSSSLGGSLYGPTLIALAVAAGVGIGIGGIVGYSAARGRRRRPPREVAPPPRSG